MLIKCIECGHTVSDKAISCPGCGCPVTTVTTLLSVQDENKKPRTRKKHKKLPNGYGSIKKLSGNRRNPYAAYPPTSGFKLNGSPITMSALGYYDDWYKAFDALREYNKNPRDLSNDNLTYEDVYNMFFKSKYIDNQKRVFSASTITASKAAFKNTQALHKRIFKTLRKADLQSIVDQCPLKHASLELIINLYKQMYKFALENDIVDKDYSKFVVINIPDDDEGGVPFSAEEIKILWDNASNATVQMILVMIYSGFRISAFKTMHINLDEHYFKGGVKTAAGKNRIVPIHSAIYNFVTTLFPQDFDVQHFRIKCFYPTLKSLGILTSSNGTKHTPHDCRHTFSWLCDTYGVDTTSKHMLMGHSLGSDVEAAVYGHRTIEQLRAEVEKIKV